MLGAVACGALALAGCANSAARRGPGDLAALQRALLGTYTSNSADGGADAAGSSAVTLTIQPVTALVLGDAVFYVRETPADNPHLVLAQGIWTLALGAVRGRGHDKSDKSDQGPLIVEHRFLFKDPRRWVGLADNPDLLLSILPQDLQAMPGCDLIWHKTSTGFETGGAPDACHPGTGAQGVWVEQHAELGPTQLSLIERRTLADGGLDNSGPALSLQLTRSGSAP